MKRLIMIFMLAIMMTGCVTPFSQFYYDQTNGVDITKLPNVIISQDEPKMFRGNNEEEDYLQMLENGYDVVGYSSFNAGNVDENGAIFQAQKVHASIVLLYSKYTGTVTGAMPLTLPNTQTSTTSLYGSAYGSGGYTGFSGTASTTTYGTQTTFIPFAINRADYLATYWVKRKTPIFGVYVQDLTNEIRQKIKSNKGILLIAIIKGSPAFQADLFRGDILKKIGDHEVYDKDSFMKLARVYAGKKARIIILRNGEEIEKEIQFNEAQ